MRAQRELLGVVALLSLCATGNAAPDDKEKAFRAGVELMKRGGCLQTPVKNEDDCREALARFRESQQVAPELLGALRNMAIVEEALGRWASAALHFEQLAKAAANDAKRADWVKEASARAALLLPKVPRLTVSFEGEAPPEVTVDIDGQNTPSALGPAGALLDPGLHTVRVRAKAVDLHVESVRLDTGEKKTVKVAAITPAPAPSKPPAVQPLRTTQVDEPPTATSSTAPWWLIGAGGVALAGGAVFGALTFSEKASACDDSGCTRDGVSRARTFGHASTAFFVGGVVLAGVGTSWLLLRTPPSQPGAKSAVALGFGPTSAELTVTF